MNSITTNLHITLLLVIIFPVTTWAQPKERKANFALSSQLNYSIIESLKGTDVDYFSIQPVVGAGVTALWENNLHSSFFVLYGLRLSVKQHQYKFDGLNRSSGSFALRLPLLFEKKQAFKSGQFLYSIGTEVNFYANDYTAIDSIFSDGKTLSSRILTKGFGGFYFPLSLGVGYEYSNKKGRKKAFVAHANKGFQTEERAILEKYAPRTVASLVSKGTNFSFSYRHYLHRNGKEKD